MDKDKQSIEDLYLKERKKSKILLVVSIVLAIALAGTGYYALQKKAGVPFGGGSGGGMMFRNSGGQQGGMNLSRFFNSDKSLNQSAVDTFLSQVPDNFKSQLVDRFSQRISNAASNGQITQAQADALTNYLKSKAGQ